MSAAALLAEWATAAAEARPVLDALDAAAGDGDHGSTVARGAAAAAAGAHEDEGSDGAVLSAASRRFTDAAGGAAGPLLGVVLRCMGDACADGAFDREALAVGLTEAARAVARLGGAVPGDGTLLDALVAAAASPDGAAAAADRAAQETAGVPKRRGRAATVEGAGLGYEDPGARSIALLVAVVEARLPPRTVDAPRAAP